jgi:hypothetical protein
MQNNPGFEVATELFWSTFFINQRGCPRVLIRPLFKQLVSNNTYFTNASKEDFEAQLEKFQDGHNVKMLYFHQSLEGIALHWMKTPAGIAWIEHLQAQRLHL